MRLVRTAIILLGCVCLAGMAFAQGNTTGTISGKVTDPAGLAVPGVTVSVQSDALQGVKSATTSANGDYVIPFLPAGHYTISFELQGFKTVKRTQSVAVAETVTVNTKLEVAAVSETVQVVGKAEVISQSAQAATSYKSDLIDKLPTNRTLGAAVALAPGVSATGPASATTIHGALSYESLYLVNGVVVNENLRGQALDLYIEDAIQETTTQTSGVSAEYGRFAGGVVNAITKSGGNLFSGSLRTTFTNDAWRSFVTPYKKADGTPGDTTKTHKVVPTYEGTAGGPILRDKIWFFGAGRYFDQTTTRQTASYTSISYPNERIQKRMEGKLTYSLTPSNTIKGSYQYIGDTEKNNVFQTVLDLRSLVAQRKTPQDLLSLNYTSVIKQNLFFEAQFSRRHFTFQGSGAPSTDIIDGTLLLDQQRGSARYWSPTFCGVCSDEKRDNRDLLLKGTYFASTSRGSHNVVFGFDMFDDQRTANNHQSGSDYRIYGTTSIISADGTIYPVFDNNNTTYIMYNPILIDSKGNDFKTTSLFVNDTWRYNTRLTMNLGLRWDRNDGTDQAGTKVVKDSAFSPRLSMTYDPKGDGKWTVNGSFARYVTSVANSIADSASAGGNPATYTWWYTGPKVNVGAGPYQSIPAGLATLFGWFNANGGPNGSLPLRSASTPGVNVKIGGALKSPHTNEYAVGLTRQVGRGAVRADVIYRKYADFYASRTDLSTGFAVDPASGRKFDVAVYENTNAVKRDYIGGTFQASYRLVSSLDIGGNYTLSRLRGNFEGENAGSGPVTSGVLNYPEYWSKSWSYPVGYLGADQRHRIRIFATYQVPTPAAFGTLSIGVVEQIASGTPYGGSGSIDSRSYVANPGYQIPPSSVTYWFTARDAFKTDTSKRFDLSVNYGHRLGVGRAQVFAQAHVYNVFNQFDLFNWNNINTTIDTRSTKGTLQAFNPFSTTPVEGVNWAYGSSFGKATGTGAYTRPRTFDFNVGFRF